MIEFFKLGVEGEDNLIQPNRNHQRGINGLPIDEHHSASESESSKEGEDDGVETITDALGNTVMKA